MIKKGLFLVVNEIEIEKDIIVIFEELFRMDVMGKDYLLRKNIIVK